MRLTDFERAAIRAAVAKRFGDRARVLLFGSRVDDHKRGGDIDLLVELVDRPVEPVMDGVRLETDLVRAIGERKIDILLTYPGATESPVHRIARETGVPV